MPRMRPVAAVLIGGALLLLLTVLLLRRSPRETVSSPEALDLYQKGVALASGDPAAALEPLTRTVSLDPDFGPAHHALAMAAFRAHKESLARDAAAASLRARWKEAGDQAADEALAAIVEG